MSFLYKRLSKLAEIASKKDIEKNLSSKQLKLEKLKYAKIISAWQHQNIK